MKNAIANIIFKIEKKVLTFHFDFCKLQPAILHGCVSFTSTTKKQSSLQLKSALSFSFRSCKRNLCSIATKKLMGLFYLLQRIKKLAILHSAMKKSQRHIGVPTAHAHTPKSITHPFIYPNINLFRGVIPYPVGFT